MKLVGSGFFGFHKTRDNQMGFLGFTEWVFFFFLNLIWVFVSVGFWWVVGSGGVVGMVEARRW